VRCSAVLLMFRNLAISDRETKFRKLNRIRTAPKNENQFMMLQVAFSLDKNLFSNDLRKDIDLKHELRIQSICIPLFHPRVPDFLKSNNDPMTRSDEAVSGNHEWNNNFSCKMTFWIDLESRNKYLRSISVDRFDQELSYASHLGIKNILLPPPRWSIGIANYCYCLMKYLNSSANLQFNPQKLLIPLPFISPLAVQASDVKPDLQTDAEGNENYPHEYHSLNEASWNTWFIWNRIRSHLNYSTFVGLAMEINSEFQDFLLYYYEQDLDYLNFYLKRWCIEPVKMVIIPTSSFVMNSHGFPVFSKSLQFFMKFMMKFSPIQFQLQGKSHFRMLTNLKESSAVPPPGLKESVPLNEDTASTQNGQNQLYENGSYLPYFHYLKFLLKTVEEDMFSLSPYHESEKFSFPYYDVLQFPLQPLMDNLESCTYETFEKDPIKYSQYEKAIGKALVNIYHQLQRKEMVEDNTEKEKNDTKATRKVNVMVVGAGRGPLIVATLSASNQYNIPIKIYVVEKNPYAIITLRNRMRQERWDLNHIEIISKDMRQFHCKENCDLIVSELLGSFGDNELSPECLYQTEHNLHRNSISIPTSYTSFLQPISSPFLYTSARDIYQNFSHQQIPSYSNQHNCSPAPSVKGLETPFVVLMKKYFALDKPKGCWTFTHPSWNDTLNLMEDDSEDGKMIPDVKRFSQLEFCSNSAGVLHGFAGYFEANLYDNEDFISIHPESSTPGMFSWFPIYFPLISPVTLQKGDKIVLNIWR
jgi:protein arginine N-methyltransferase 5